ncbi:MAG: DUF4347 domain-containing protein [Saprospiraceae bacterium]|nr:DUF4347 domain-containing protein [Saprospiraceae bacterium]
MKKDSHTWPSIGNSMPIKLFLWKNTASKTSITSENISESSICLKYLMVINYAHLALVGLIICSLMFVLAKPMHHSNIYVDNGIDNFPVISNSDPSVFQLFSHGRPGELLIKGEWKNAKQIAEFIDSRIHNATTEIHNVNIYGCEFAKGKVGEDAIRYLESTLGISVAASTNLSGSDGDWVLEMGQPVAAIAISDFKGNLQCAAGTVAPILSNYGGLCPPATTLDISAITASNTPSGAMLTWHSGTPATTANQITAPTAATFGVYFAAFKSTSAPCYSGVNGDGTATTKITIGKDDNCNGIADAQECAPATPLITNGNFNGNLAGWTGGSASSWELATNNGYATNTVMNSADNAINYPLSQTVNFSQANVTGGMVHLSFDAGTNNFIWTDGTTAYSASVQIKLGGVVYATLNNPPLGMTATATASNGAIITPSSLPVWSTSSQATSQSNLTHFDLFIPATSLPASGDLLFNFNSSLAGDDWFLANIKLDGVGNCICTANSTAPAITATTVSNTCPSSTFNLNSLVNSGTAPDGATLVWSGNNPPTSENDTLTAEQAAAINIPGTYYAYYRNSTYGCFSPADSITFVPICCSNTLSYSQYATSATGNAGASWGSNTGVVGTPNVTSAGADIAANRLSVASWVSPGVVNFANPITPGDTITMYVRKFNGYNGGFAISLNGSPSNTGFIDTINASQLTTTTYPYNIIKVVVPITPIDGSYNSINIVGTDLGGASLLLFDAIKVSRTYCNSCAAGTIAPAINATSVTNSCPTTTVNLTSLANTGTLPTGTTLVWSLNNPPTNINDTLTTAQVTSAATGVKYYAFYRDGLNNCFSPADSVLATLFTCPTPCTDPLLMAATCDFDDDGVINSVDLDDDNDGVLDAVESPNCYYTAAEANNIIGVTTGLNVGTGSTALLYNDISVSASPNFAFTSGQQLAGANIFTVEYPTPVKLTSLTIVNAASLGTGSTGSLYGSNDGITWTDLMTTTTSLATTASKVLTVNQNAGEYKFYRVQGEATSSSTTGAVYEITSIANTTNYIPSAHPKASCVGTNTDGDNIPNNFDLDSDNDGCPDSFESGTTASNTSIASEPFSANGFADGLETSIESGVYNDTYTYNKALNNTINNCTVPCSDPTKMAANCDFDGDGIVNSVDLDDDNDGVPDAIESCVSGNQVTFRNVRDVSSNGGWTTLQADMVVGGVVVGTVTWQSNLDWTTSDAGRGTTYDGKYLFYSTATGVTDADGTSTVTGFDGALLTITPLPGYTFSGTINFVENANLSTLNQGENGYTTGGADNSGTFTHEFSTNADGTDINATFVEYGTNTTYVGNYNTGDDFNNTTPIIDQQNALPQGTSGGSSSAWGALIPFNSTSTSPFTFNYYAPTNAVAWETSSISFDNLNVTCASNDLDGDGISNELDLDSDGDGCPDAVEASVAGTLESGTVVNPSGTTTLPSSIAEGPYGENGLANNVESNDGSNPSITYNNTYNLYAINSSVNLCSDFDNDGVPDFVDLDDDNDGILDAVESPTCFYTQAEAQKIVSITSDMTTNTYSPAATNAPGTNLSLLYDGNTSNYYTRITANSLLLNGMSVYTVKYSTPIQISSLTLVKGAMLTYNVNSYVLQGSNDNMNWTTISSPTNDVNGNLTLTNTSTTKYQYYRVLDNGYVSGTTGNISQTASYPTRYTSEISITYPTTSYVASAYPKPSCTGSDADSDGIPNHLDLDADGDGCSDAYEAGVTTHSGVVMFSGTAVNRSPNISVTMSNAIVAGPYDANGFANSVETTLESGLYANTYTYSQASNASINNCLTLPLELISFKGQKVTGGNLLNWITKDEKDINYFRLYRSLDGIHFHFLTEIDSKSLQNNVSQELRYQFLDPRPNAGLNYYKLSAVEFSNLEEFFNVIILDNSIKGKKYTVRPTIVRTNVIVDINSFDQVQLSIFSLDGKLQFAKTIDPVVSGNLQVEVDMNHLPSGFYFISIYDAGSGQRFTEKVVKE